MSGQRMFDRGVGMGEIQVVEWTVIAGKGQKAWQYEVVKSSERFTMHCGHVFLCGSHELLITCICRLK